MATKGRLSKEQKESNNENISKIINLTTQIKEIVTDLYGESCKTSYLKSVENLEKKNEKYTTKEPFRITESEQELIKKIRAGEIDISTLRTSGEGPDVSVSEISTDEIVQRMNFDDEKKKTAQKKGRR